MYYCIEILYFFQTMREVGIENKGGFVELRIKGKSTNNNDDSGIVEYLNNPVRKNLVKVFSHSHEHHDNKITEQLPGSLNATSEEL